MVCPSPGTANVVFLSGDGDADDEDEDADDDGGGGDGGGCVLLYCSMREGKVISDLNST